MHVSSVSDGGRDVGDGGDAGVWAKCNRRQIATGELPRRPSGRACCRRRPAPPCSRRRCCPWRPPPHAPTRTQHPTVSSVSGQAGSLLSMSHARRRWRTATFVATYSASSRRSSSERKYISLDWQTANSPEQPDAMYHSAKRTRASWMSTVPSQHDFKHAAPDGEGGAHR